MSGLGQFNETRAYSNGVQITSSATPGAAVNFGSTPNGDFRVDSIVITSTDIVDRAVQIQFGNGNQAILGYVNVPAGAGQGSVPAVDYLTALAVAGLVGGFAIPQGDDLYWAILTAPTAAHTVQIAVLGGLLF